jgi:hypothetical protein
VQIRRWPFFWPFLALLSLVTLGLFIHTSRAQGPPPAGAIHIYGCSAFKNPDFDRYISTCRMYDAETHQRYIVLFTGYSATFRETQ